MSVEIGILLAIVAGIIGIATFFLGRQSVAKNEGKALGVFEANLNHMQSDISYIRGAVDSNNKDNKESIRRLHKRIDDHEREYHNKIITRDEDSEV